MTTEAESGGVLHDAGARLDAALDPARLRSDLARSEAERLMPWQRPGVAVEDAGLWGMARPMRWWTIVLISSFPAMSFVAIELMKVKVFGVTWGTVLKPLGVMAMMAMIMLSNNWVMLRARRTGDPYAPPWMWALPVAAVAGGLGAVLLGWVQIMYLPLLIIVGFSCGAGLLFPMRKRRGFDLHCARCDYAYPYTAMDGPRAPDVCSECGATWHERGGLVRGTKVTRGGWRMGVYLAVVVCFFGITSMRRSTLRVMPTGTLIQMVTQPRAGFTVDEWGELSTRPLSQAQRDRLATRLLELRLQEGGPTREADAWLDAEVTAGRLPQAIVDRYHGEMFEGRLVGPARARVGERVRVEFDPVARITPFTVRDVLVAFEGFEWSDRQGQWQGRSTMLSSAMFLGRRAAPGVGDEAPSVQTVFEQPGRYRVRAVYWVVFMPQFAQPSPITWTDTGPAPPAGALHMERREVEMWVDVVAN